MVNKSIIYLVILMSFISCSKTQVVKEQSPGVTVDWTQIEKRPIPKIENTNDQDTYGPSLEQSSQTAQNRENKNLKDDHKPLALIIGPGLYRSLGVISCLKELNLNTSFKPTIIMGHGLSAVIATYYAFGYKPDYIEWKFYQFLRKALDKKVFSDDWKETAQKFLINEFKDKKIEDSKLTLIIPVLEGRTQKITYLKRGDLVASLQANLNLGKFNQDGPAFSKEFFNKELLADLGVERTLGIDLVSQGISWKVGSGYLNGIYEKAASQFLRARDALSFTLSYPFEDYPLDDSTSISKLIFHGQEFSKKQLSVLSEKAAPEQN